MTPHVARVLCSALALLVLCSSAGAGAPLRHSKAFGSRKEASSWVDRWPADGGPIAARDLASGNDWRHQEDDIDERDSATVFGNVLDVVTGRIIESFKSAQRAYELAQRVLVNPKEKKRDRLRRAETQLLTAQDEENSATGDLAALHPLLSNRRVNSRGALPRVFSASEKSTANTALQARSPLRAVIRQASAGAAEFDLRQSPNNAQNVSDWAKEMLPCSGVGQRIWAVNDTAVLCKHKHCFVWELSCGAEVLLEAGYTGLPANATNTTAVILSRTDLRANQFANGSAMLLLTSCNILSVICDDFTITQMDESYGVSECRAVALACEEDLVIKYYEVANQTSSSLVSNVSSLTMKNFTDCEVQMSCNEPEGNYGLPIVRSETGFAPQAFGFIVWGARCRKQRITCNGVPVVLDPDFEASWSFADAYGNCSSEFTPCNFAELDAVVNEYWTSQGSDVGPFQPQRCEHIESVCEGELVPTSTADGVGGAVVEQQCAFSQLRVDSSVCQVNVSSPSAGWRNTWPTVRCAPDTLICGGNATSAESVPLANAGFSNCTIETLRCSDANIPSAAYSVVDVAGMYGSGTCLAGELLCPNIAASAISGNYSACTIPNMVCNNAPATGVNCSLVVPVCASAPTCQLTEASECASCRGPLNVSSCVCPIDKYGPVCEKNVPLECTVDLDFPTKRCLQNLRLWWSEEEIREQKIELLDGDWPCLVFDLDQKARLDWTLRCRTRPDFEYPPDSPNATEAQRAAAGFVYDIENTGRDGWSFKLTSKPRWGMRWKIFNFNRLSDDDHVYYRNLTAAQITGDAIIPFETSLPIGDIDAQRFWHGNRLYSELSWQDEVGGNRQPDGVRRVLAREFMDNPTFIKYKGTLITPDNTTTVLVWSFVAVIFFFLVAGYCVCSWRRKRRHRKMMEAKSD